MKRNNKLQARGENLNSAYGCECVENHVLNIEGHSVLLLDEEVEVFSLSIDGVNMLISAR